MSSLTWWYSAMMAKNHSISSQQQKKLFLLQKVVCQLSSCKLSVALFPAEYFPVLSSVGVWCKTIMGKAAIKQGVDLIQETACTDPLECGAETATIRRDWWSVYFCLRIPVNVPMNVQDLGYFFTSGNCSWMLSVDLWQWHIFTCGQIVPLRTTVEH